METDKEFDDACEKFSNALSKLTPEELVAIKWGDFDLTVYKRSFYKSFPVAEATKTILKLFFDLALDLEEHKKKTDFANRGITVHQLLGRYRSLGYYWRHWVRKCLGISAKKDDKGMREDGDEAVFTCMAAVRIGKGCSDSERYDVLTKFDTFLSEAESAESAEAAKTTKSSN